MKGGRRKEKRRGAMKKESKSNKSKHLSINSC